MIVAGYKIVAPLMDALGLPKDLNVTSLTLQADVPGGCTITLKCLVPELNPEKLESLIKEYRVVLEEIQPDGRYECPPSP